MKKNRYQHIVLGALVSITLLQGNLRASDEEEGLTNKLCRIMKARADEQRNFEEEAQEEGRKCLEIIITIPRRALAGLANYLAPEQPPTFFERVSSATIQARSTLRELLKNPH